MLELDPFPNLTRAHSLPLARAVFFTGALLIFAYSRLREYENPMGER